MILAFSPHKLFNSNFFLTGFWILKISGIKFVLSEAV